MSRRLLVGAAGISAVLLLSPAPVAAHAIGGTFQLPVPLWLYLAGAAIAVAASFVVTSIVAREQDAARAYPTRPIADGLVSVARAVLRLLGLVWWYGAILVGFVVGDISP